MGEMNIEIKLSILIMHPLLESKVKSIMKWFLTKPIPIFRKLKESAEEILESWVLILASNLN